MKKHKQTLTLLIGLLLLPVIVYSIDRPTATDHIEQAEASTSQHMVKENHWEEALLPKLKEANKSINAMLL